MKKAALTIAFGLLSSVAFACTIFTLVGPDRVLFGNNEDYSNPVGRIWFVPGDREWYGCAYVGFDNGWAQGGINEKGVAFDWVAGYYDDYVPEPSMEKAKGNPAERMLESSGTLEEAVDFFRRYREPSFAQAKIMVSDKTGRSAIIGSKDGKLDVVINETSAGFGFGGAILDSMLVNVPDATPENAEEILRACVQPGQYATKYSTVYDLNSGDILIADPAGNRESMKLNLAEELAKGPHYYDIPAFGEPFSHTARPLLLNMERLLGYEPPLQDEDGKVTEKVTVMWRDIARGAITRGIYAEEFGTALPQYTETFRSYAEMAEVMAGEPESVYPVRRDNAGNGTNYVYVTVYENLRVVTEITVTYEGLLSSMQVITGYIN